MKARFINLFWSVCKKGRGYQAPRRRCSRGWAGRACCLHHGSAARLPAGTETCCPGLALWWGQGRGRLRGRAAGIPPLPQTHLPGGGSPRPPGKLQGAAWPGSASLGLPAPGTGEGEGCPGRVKAFQAEISQQKAGSASELKSKC